MARDAETNIRAWGQANLPSLKAVGVGIQALFGEIASYVQAGEMGSILGIRSSGFTLASRLADLRRGAPSGDETFDESIAQLADRLGRVARLCERAEPGEPPANLVAEATAAVDALGPLFSRLAEVGIAPNGE